MAQKLGKHTPYFELFDAQSQAGCPICRLIRKATSRYLDSILYEAVLDPDVRAKLKAAQGFCAEHVEMLRHKPGSALGIALIYRDIIRSVSETADGARFGGGATLLSRLLGGRGNRPVLAARLAVDRPCPACEVGRGFERSYLDLLIAYLDDEEFYNAYAAGEGLCLPHLIGAIGRVRDEMLLDRLVRPQLERYLVMLRDLDEFIRKRDHRFRHEKYGEEGDVWLRAMNAIVGGAGMGLSARAGGRRSTDVDEETT